LNYGVCVRSVACLSGGIFLRRLAAQLLLSLFKLSVGVHLFSSLLSFLLCLGGVLCLGVFILASFSGVLFSLASFSS
jgi:uncharacterized membrane protein YidH (DUF202 family)